MPPPPPAPGDPAINPLGDTPPCPAVPDTLLDPPAFDELRNPFPPIPPAPEEAVPARP